MWIVLGHALCNALIPSFTVIMLQIDWLVGSVVVVESFLASKGFGSPILEASLASDIFLLQACTAICVLIAAETQTLVDIGCGLHNPRIRIAPPCLPRPARGARGGASEEHAMIVSDSIATRSEVAGTRGVVAGGHADEAAAGIAMIEAGGNAIDALVAAAFVGFVVEPASCGLGGYGRLSVWLGGARRFVTFDHYVRAPAAARPDMFAIDPSKPMKYYGFPHTLGMRAEEGPLAPAIPGAVAGLCDAHAMFGRLPLAQVVEPAIAAAEAGIPVTWSLQLTIADRLAKIRELPEIARWLLRGGLPPKAAGPVGAGDRLDGTDLARTLRRIAEHGKRGFYEGPVAAAIERACVGGGGILTAADLARYRTRILEEQPGRYRGLDYVTAYDQVAYEALNILDHFDLAAMGRDSLGFRHLVAEALACGFVDSMTHYGDPDFETSPVEGLASPAFGRMRAAGLSIDRALPRPVRPQDPWPFDAAAPRPARVRDEPGQARLEGTSQMASADAEGNMCALITSLTSGFGSLVLAPGTGVVLNNAMQNFDPRPDQANCIRPGKMPIFAAPSLVAAKDGRAVFAGCGSGGYRIATGVLHAFLHAVDFGLGPQAAVDAPRVHCQGHETHVDPRIPETLRAGLARLGHAVVVQGETPGVNAYGRVNAILAGDDGTLRAGTGPAWGTAAASC
jgi:gamma-glutamyltranspeptidase/glutathione hydrolase